MEKDKYKEQFSGFAAAAFRKEYPDLYNEIGDAEMFDAEVLYHLLEKPKDPRMGRFALPVFRFVRRLSQKPLDVASRIAVSTNRLLASNGHDSPLLASATGGFINVNIDQTHLAGEILNKILSAPAQYGESHIGSGKTVLVEYSSPNIAKPFGVGHLRTTIIGNSLRRVFKRLGYNVVGINYPGDWGTQFGKMIVAYRRWGNEQTFQGDVIHNLLDLYVRFHREAESDASLDEEAREAFRKLEAGDDQYLKLWEQFKEVSYAEFQRIYDLMGVEFDLVIGESFLNDKMDAVIERLKRDGLVRISDGAMIVDIDDPNLPPAMLRKADGATLYLTRDLTGAIYRWETYHFAESLYVVGSSQADHFRQMLHVLGKMEAAENVPEDQRMVNRIKHIDFGWVRFGRKTMATRLGNIIFLEDVITRAVDLVKGIMHEKNPDLPQPEKIAQMVGVGAVFYSQLSVRRNKDVNFVWEDVLNFEGESGPYLQYTHARLCSLLRSCGESVDADFDATLLAGQEEQRIIEHLADFPEIIHDVARNYEPYLLVQYLLKLSAAFNKLYQRKSEDGRIDRILSDNQELSRARMALVRSVQAVLKEGLYLLGIDAPEEM